MTATSSARVWPVIGRLTERQRGTLRYELARTPSERSVLAALNGAAFRPRSCPHCGHQRLQRWGLAAGLQRYRCTACLRTCNPLTGTPLTRLRRRDLWLDHAEALTDGVSLRAAARRLGVHHHTTFRWRHRWLVRPAGQQAVPLGAVVAIDALPFHATGKGWRTGRRVAIPVEPSAPSAGAVPGVRSSGRPLVWALLLRDRGGRQADALLPGLDGPAIAEVLRPFVDDRPTMLVGDSRPALAAAARMLGMAHRPVLGEPTDASGRVRGSGHGYAARLATWMVRFRGVSTRYLGHYLGWRRTLERRPGVPDPLTWLRLAHGRGPTPNVGKVGGPGAVGPPVGQAAGG